MKVLAFLGNPGNKYNKNRHNAGFIIGKMLADEMGINLNQKQFSSLYGKGKIKQEDVVILFPQTFMNSSGRAVRGAMDYFKLEPDDLIVVHDEIELPFGDVNIKTGGGHKGHNGIRSIGQELGTLEFTRLRIGVGRQTHPDMAVADYVLSDFTGEELGKLSEMFPSISEKISALF